MVLESKKFLVQPHRVTHFLRQVDSTGISLPPIPYLKSCSYSIQCVVDSDTLTQPVFVSDFIDKYKRWYIHKIKKNKEMDKGMTKILNKGSII